MSPLENSVVQMFFGVTAIVFLWRFIREKEWTKFSTAHLESSWKYVLVITALFAAAFAGLNAFNAGLLAGACYFAGAFLISFLLSEIDLTPYLRGLLLLAASVGLTILVPKESLQLAISSSLCGLAVWKLSSNIMRSETATLLDFLPPFVWLVSVMWWSVAHVSQASALNLGVILGALTVSQFLRWAQMPLLHEDPVYLKRIMLSASGGLMLLIMITKMLLATKLSIIAAVAGAGFLMSFIFDSLDNAKFESSVQNSLTKLILVGALLLAGSRLFGTEASLVLAASAVLVQRSGLAQVAGLFFGLRVLQQSFDELFNSNVTGININHEYVNAAFFLAFVLAAVLAAALRDYKPTKFLAGFASLACFLVAGASCYLLHSEPTAALIAGAVMAATILAMTGKWLLKEETGSSQNVILLPAIIGSSCVAAYPLLEAGNEAVMKDRLLMIGALAVFFLIAAIISFAIGGGFRKKPSDTPTDAPTDTPAAPTSA
jgi:hypothetical protein